MNGFGGILADDMGLGKTIQIIALLQAEAEAHPESQSLIVCPASLVYNWENELKRRPNVPRYILVCIKSGFSE